MPNELTVKNIDYHTMQKLQSGADKLGMDINAYTLAILKQAMAQKTGREQDAADKTLATFADAWSEEDTDAFMKAAGNVSNFDYESWT